ncbi:MAG: hypothetical protein LBU06_11065 [Desulfovibrio sp.]|nr:hypothetical protein [Desulfovibrio sp.]
MYGQSAASRRARPALERTDIEKVHPPCGALPVNPCREVVAGRTRFACGRQAQTQNAPGMRLAAALACLALLLFGAGMGLCGLSPGPGPAHAVNASGQTPSSAVFPQRAALLQTTVDSVALSLGRAFAEEAALDMEARTRMLRKALSSLILELGGGIYFTAWQGTRNVCSPLSPDAEGLDFAGNLDADGAPFVLEMESLAGRGGGFLYARLPLARPGEESPGPVLEHLIYARQVPADAGIFLAAFLPVAPVEEGGFPASWTLARHEELNVRALDNLRKGLFLSGFSLSGLSGLLLAFSRGSKDRGACAA